jgi:ribosomal RNA-processing protein 9
MSASRAKRPRGSKGRREEAAPSAAKRVARAPDVDLHWEDDEVSSVEGSVDDTGVAGARSHAPVREDVDSEHKESADERRLRLAREYLARTRVAAASSADQDAAVAETLAADAEAAGFDGKTVVRSIAHLLSKHRELDARFLRGHELPATCVALTGDGRLAYSGSKDCSIIAWDLEAGTKRRWPGRRRTRTDLQQAEEARRTGRASSGGDARLSSSGGGALERLAKDGLGDAAGVAAGAVALRTGEIGYGIEGHWDQVLCLAVSEDGKHVVSGGRDWLVRVWSPASGSVRHVFRGHAGAVTGVCFADGSARAYTSSEDRTIKGWDVETNAFAEVLYGHATSTPTVAALRHGRLLSAGGQDRTCRVWKLEAETQLVFRGTTASVSIDCVAPVFGGRMFVSSAQDGSLQLWSTERKKPVGSIPHAHGEGNWISSLSSVPNSDLVVSGSSDGWIRFWRVGNGVGLGEADGDWRSARGFQEVARAPATGFVNGLAFARDASTLVAAVGCEHRLGRWWRLPGVKSGIVVVAMPGELADAFRLPSQRRTEEIHDAADEDDGEKEEEDEAGGEEEEEDDDDDDE